MEPFKMKKMQVKRFNLALVGKAVKKYKVV